MTINAPNVSGSKSNHEVTVHSEGEVHSPILGPIGVSHRGHDIPLVSVSSAQQVEHDGAFLRRISNLHGRSVTNAIMNQRPMFGTDGKESLGRLRMPMACYLDVGTHSL